jgi:hypothetical protein
VWDLLFLAKDLFVAAIGIPARINRDDDDGVSVLMPGYCGDPGGASLHGRERTGWHEGAGRRTSVPMVMKSPAALTR